MGFSNQVIVPRDPFKPHIVKLQGLWRVSPYRWKKLWSIGVSGYWDKAHAYTRKLNDEILAEEQAAKERQREFKRQEHELQLLRMGYNAEQCLQMYIPKEV